MIDAPQLIPGLIDNVTELHRYQFHLGRKPLVVAGRQRRLRAPLSSPQSSTKLAAGLNPACNFGPALAQSL